MAYTLNQNSDNYNGNAANFGIQEHVLTSQNMSKNLENVKYFAGKKEEGKLKLIPIEACFQMRPSFDHIDRELEQRTISGDVQNNVSKPTLLGR